MTIKDHEHKWRDVSESMWGAEILQWGGSILQPRLETPYIISGFCLDKECHATRVKVLEDKSQAIIDWEDLQEERGLNFLLEGAIIHPL